MKNGINVRLNTDLTSYQKGLIVGVKGVTCNPFTEWGRSFGVGVRFETGESLDVLESGLDVIDEGYLEQLAKEKQETLEELKTARNIKVSYGPRGGFRGLSYNTKNGSTGIYGSDFKKLALEYLEVFKKEGLIIEESIE